MQKINLVGNKYERLTVISEALGTKRVSWKCQCECGKTIIVESSHLKTGHTKSCGCLNTDSRKERSNKLYENNSKYNHPSITTAKSIWKRKYKEDNLSFEDFLIISKKNCYYCNAEPDNSQNVAAYDKKSSQYAKDNGTYTYNLLIKLDISKPYDLDNIVPCCKSCATEK